VTISIVTAVRNRKSTIARAITSIKEQTYKNVECVVVDGASSDGTRELAESLVGPNDKIISEPDKGVYDALNKGLAIASGDIIGLLHSDDLYEDKQVLENVAEVFNYNAVDVVFGDAAFFKKGEPETIIRRYRSTLLSKRNLAWGQMPAHPSMFFRAEIYHRLGGFKDDYKIAADYEFLCRLVSQVEVRSVRLPRVLVRMQMGGLSTAGFRSSVVLNQEVLRALKENDIYSNWPMLLSKYPRKIVGFLSP